jgi:hypothetical protein
MKVIPLAELRDELASGEVQVATGDIILSEQLPPRTGTGGDCRRRVYCATRRLVVSPAQPGGTRREVSGSDGLPGTERIRGQEHARKATVVFRRRSDALRDPRDMAKAGLPEP